ncbi:hypothetical protein DJ71_10455 [Halorubrum sp. E3]|nr:hypothetical protein DJ71_10455 [Halorubrum sp. E3]
MNVTVEVVGEGAAEYDLPEDATYADLIREAGYHPQEASALVDGSPVPGDRVVDAEFESGDEKGRFLGERSPPTNLSEHSGPGLNKASGVESDD